MSTPLFFGNKALTLFVLIFSIQTVFPQTKYRTAEELFKRCFIELPIGAQAITDKENFLPLEQFHRTISGNDSALAQIKQNRGIDWIYFFTNAFYSKWETERLPSNEPGDTIGVTHQFGERTDSGWHSGSNSADSGKFLLHGPSYSQFMRYVFTNKSVSDRPLVSYDVVVRLKLRTHVEGIVPVCKLIVQTIKNGKRHILAERIFTSDLFDVNEFKDFYLQYDYSHLITEYLDPGKDTLIKFATSSGLFDPERKICFDLQWLGNGDLEADYLEVLDTHIWKHWFQDDYILTVTKLRDFSNQLASLTGGLSHYHVINQPYSIDCLEPIRRMQFLLDSLGTGIQFMAQPDLDWDARYEPPNEFYKYCKHEANDQKRYSIYPLWRQ